MKVKKITLLFCPILIFILLVRFTYAAKHDTNVSVLLPLDSEPFTFNVFNGNNYIEVFSQEINAITINAENESLYNIAREINKYFKAQNKDPAFQIVFVLTNIWEHITHYRVSPTYLEGGPVYFLTNGTPLVTLHVTNMPVVEIVGQMMKQSLQTAQVSFAPNFAVVAPMNGGGPIGFDYKSVTIENVSKIPHFYYPTEFDFFEKEEVNQEVNQGQVNQGQPPK